MSPSTSAAVERFAGLLTPVLGIGGAAIATFAPLASHESCESTVGGGEDCRAWTSSLWSDEPGPAIALLFVVGVLSLAVAVMALTDTRGPARRRALLLAASVLLAGSAVVLAASVGVFILPASLAALAALVAAYLRVGGGPHLRGAGGGSGVTDGSQDS